MGAEDRMTTTLRDVADRANVSMKTVSNVLHGKHARVGPATRARVLEAIEELKYRPNMAAQMLRTRQTHSIGFVTDEVASTPYSGAMIKGAQDLAWAHRKILIVVNTGSNQSILEAAVEMMLERRVEGIIYAAMFHKVVEAPTAMHEVPAVLLNCFSADRSFLSIVPDEVTGGREATETLLKKGHRRIGFVNVGRRIPAATGRLEGYKQALAMYNVPFDPDLVRSGNSLADSGYTHTMDLMRLPEPPTALFCGSDRMAMGAYMALQDLNFRIPDDVAVRGFDDQEMVSAYLRPPLSTTRLPYIEMGEWAVNYLLGQRPSTENGRPGQHLVYCPLVERESI